MKKIYFIRHAKSSWNEPYLDDFDRPLNKRGKHDAPMMANRLKQHSIFPDIIISSPALRAKKTASKIAKVLEYDKGRILFCQELYNGGFENYLHVIGNIDNSHDTVFLVAHNPDITDMSERLGNIIIGNMPTCAIVCVCFDVDDFSKIEDKSGKALFFDFPKSLSVPTYQ